MESPILVSTPTKEQSKGKMKSKEMIAKTTKEGEAWVKDKEPQQFAKISPRRKMCARKSKDKEQPTQTKYYPYVLAEAKASFSDFIQKKQVIKERAWNGRKEEMRISRT